MSEVKRLNVPLTVPLALACRGGEIATAQSQKLQEKFSAVKEHATYTKITATVSTMQEALWIVLGLVVIFYGAQFKNLFLCSQVIVNFCYDRVKNSILNVYKAFQTALESSDKDKDDADEPAADAKAEAKPESKHAQKRAAKKEGDKASSQEQRDEDAAKTKKMLKVLDSSQVTSVIFELCVTFMACHMVMEGGLPKVVVVTYSLVKPIKQKLAPLFEFKGHEDVEAWTDILLNFVLYAFFGGMAVVASPLAFALCMAMCGAELVMKHGLVVAESKGKIPDGASAEAFTASMKGLGVLGGLAAFGTIWQFWALMADSGMAWYFKIPLLPAVLAECIVSLF